MYREVSTGGGILSLNFSKNGTLLGEGVREAAIAGGMPALVVDVEEREVDR